MVNGNLAQKNNTTQLMVCKLHQRQQNKVKAICIPQIWTKYV